jgi:hypothetical protein
MIFWDLSFNRYILELIILYICSWFHIVIVLLIINDYTNTPILMYCVRDPVSHRSSRNQHETITRTFFLRVTITRTLHDVVSFSNFNPLAIWWYQYNTLQLSFLIFWNSDLGGTEKFLGGAPGDYFVNSCWHHIVVFWHHIVVFFFFNGLRNDPPCKSVYCTYSLLCADICVLVKYLVVVFRLFSKDKETCWFHVLCLFRKFEKNNIFLDGYWQLSTSLCE